MKVSKKNNNKEKNKGWTRRGGGTVVRVEELEGRAKLRVCERGRKGKIKKQRMSLKKNPFPERT